MSSYYKSSKSVVVHDDRSHYQRQPSADSSYSRSSAGSSASHYSTMPPSYGSTSPSTSSTQGSQTYRSGDSKGGIKTVSQKGNVTIVHHDSRSWDKNDPHPSYRR